VRKIYETKKKKNEDLRKYRFVSDESVADEKIIPIIVDFIKRNLEEGKRVTSDDILSKLDQENISISKSTVIRKMKRWGFCWGKLTERDIRRKTNENIKKRNEYLQQLQALERGGYGPRVYIDVTKVMSIKTIFLIRDGLFLGNTEKFSKKVALDQGLLSLEQ